MSEIAGLRGMRQIALKVRDVARAKRFYQDVLGMKVVWGCITISAHQEVARSNPAVECDLADCNSPRRNGPRLRV